MTMTRYHLKKEEKHDYAGWGRKLYRRLHRAFYKILGDRKKAYPFYASYRHLKSDERKNKAPDLPDKNSDDRDTALFSGMDETTWSHGYAEVNHSVPTGQIATYFRNFHAEHYITELPAYMAGFGHGLGAWRTGLVASIRLGLPYAYTPMVTPGWETTLGLGEGMPLATELLKKGYKKVLLPYYDMNSPGDMALVRRIIRSYRGRKAVFYNEYEQWTKTGDDIYGDTLIRQIFHASPTRQKDKLLYKEKEYNIAVHIRRGDVSALLNQGDTSMQRRWLELSYYAQLMKTITELAKENRFDRKLHFYIFSEGKEEDFKELTVLHSGDAPAPDITLCLDVSAESSFLHICRADLILTAPSSFSIESGAINPCKKVVPDRDWLTYPSNEEWLVADADTGTLSEEHKKRLQQELMPQTDQ